jgi:thioredoxin-dependent peroxiredoxin
MLQPGDKAPDVSAVSTEGNMIRLYDYLGRNNVVLFFYPKDDTAGCTIEACEFRDARPRYDEANAVVLGISSDDQQAHQAFTSKYALNYPLLVDSDGKIAEAFGVPRSERGWPRRVTFLIDSDGTIQKVWSDFGDVTGHAGVVLEEAMALGRA